MADTKTTKSVSTTAASKKVPAKKAETKAAKATAKAPAKKAAPKADAKAANKPVAIKSNKPAAKKERTKGLKVTQIGSGIGRGIKQQSTLRGLGLGKMHRSRILPDTPAVRGMVNKIKHLVKMEEVG